MSAKANVDRPTAARLPLYVEAAPPPANQLQFAKKGSKFAGGVFPNEGACLLQNATRLGIAAMSAEVAE